MEVQRMKAVVEMDDRQYQATAQRVDRTFKNLGAEGERALSGIAGRIPVVGGLLEAAGRDMGGFADKTRLAGTATAGLTSELSAAAGPIGIAAAGLLATAAAGAALGKELFDLASLASDFGSQINDLSIETGLNAETLSALSTQASLSGTNLETVNTAFGRFSQIVGEASRGSEEARATLARFGVDAQKAAQSSEAAMREMLRALNDVQSDAERIDLAKALGGRGGARLITLARDINGNLNETVAQLHRMGVVIDRETVEKADKFGDSMSLMTTQAKMLGYQLGFELQPVFTSAMNSISQSMTNNQPLISGGIRLIAADIGNLMEQIEVMGGSALLTLNMLGRLAGFKGEPASGGDLSVGGGITRPKPKPTWDAAPTIGGGRHGGGARKQSVDDRGREWAERLEQQFLSLGAETEIERVNVELLSKEWAGLNTITAGRIRLTAQSITDKQKSIDAHKEEKDALDKLAQSWRRVIDSQEADLASLRGLDGPYEKLLRQLNEARETAGKYGKSLDAVIPPADQLRARLVALSISSEEATKKIEDLIVPDRVIESMRELSEALPKPKSIADAMRDFERTEGPPPVMPDDSKLRERLKEISGQFRNSVEGTISDSLVDLMQGRGAEAGRNFLLGFAESIQRGLADALSERLTKIFLDSTGLGDLFDKIAGGVLGVKVDPADIAAQGANTQAVGLNTTETSINTQATRELTIAMQQMQQAQMMAARGPSLTSTLISAGLGLALNAIMPGLGSLGSFIGGLFNGGDDWGHVGDVTVGPLTPVPSREIGGTVTRDGLAYVHRGEDIIPAEVTRGWDGPRYAWNSSTVNNYSSPANSSVNHRGYIQVEVREPPQRPPNSYHPRPSQREVGEAILKLIAPALRR